MSETDLTANDWKECRAAAISSIRNCKAQLIVYQNQLETADAQIKILEEVNPDL